MSSQRNGGISWTDETWNPTRGCSRVSPGCVNCYAERQAARFANPAGAYEDTGVTEAGPFHGFVHIVNGHPAWTGKVELIESKLLEPLHWRKPRRVFVNSMSDLFHESLPDEAIDRVFAVMAQAPQHTFQILTKRADRMLKWFSGEKDFERSREDHVDEAAGSFGWCHANVYGRWPLPNVWLGISVEDQKSADERIPLLLQTPAVVRFVSYEPALGPINFESLGVCRDYRDGTSEAVTGLDWMIVGGESGPGARPFDIAWARNTIEQCKDAGVACFVKQLGANVGLPLKDRKGGEWEEWPEDMRVREFPR